jgi:hypothetical protein
MEKLALFIDAIMKRCATSYFVAVRYSAHILNMAKKWLRLPHLDPLAWNGFDDVISWWSNEVLTNEGRRKLAVPLIMLVSWELWNARGPSQTKAPC